MSEEFVKNALRIIGEEIENMDDLCLLIYFAILQKNEEKVSKCFQKVLSLKDDYDIAEIVNILLDTGRPELARRATEVMLNDREKLECLQKIASATKDGQDFQKLIDFIDTMMTNDIDRDRAYNDMTERLANADKFVWARILNKKYSGYQARTIIKAALKVKNYDEAIKVAFDENESDCLIDIIMNLVRNDQLDIACRTAELIETKMTYRKHYYAALAFTVIGFNTERKEYLSKAHEASLNDIKSSKEEDAEIGEYNFEMLAIIGILIEDTQAIKTVVQGASKLKWERRKILQTVLSKLNKSTKGDKTTAK